MHATPTAVTTIDLPNAGPRLFVKVQHSDSTPDDFFWAYTEEPHKTRRQAIIKAHPEVAFLQSLYNFSPYHRLT